jgi:hypothetical protein
MYIALLILLMLVSIISLFDCLGNHKSMSEYDNYYTKEWERIQRKQDKRDHNLS